MDSKARTKCFVRLTLDDNGIPSAERAAAICAYIGGLDCSDEKKAAALRAYRRQLIPLLEKERIVAELSGEATERALDLLRKIVERERGGKPGRMEVRKNASLLGGVRLTIADTIIERSARQAIENALR